MGDRAREISRWVSSLPYQTGTSLRPPCDSKLDIPPVQEDHRARFFEHYRKEAKNTIGSS